MRKTSLFALAVLFVLAFTHAADARPRPRRGKRFEANKTFGIGLMFGAPTGLTGKYFYASDKAFDFGIGAIGYWRGRSGFHIHADHLWHPVSLASTAPFELPLYLGVGARVYDFGYGPNDNRADAIGVRVPIGIAFDFNNVPLDIFFEVAFVADVFVDYGDTFGVDLDPAIGIRYWF